MAGVGMISRFQASRGWPKRVCRTRNACIRFGTSPSGGFSPSSYRSAIVVPLSVEFFDEPREARVVEPGLPGLVERRAVEQPRVALADLLADRRVRPGDREGVHHLVGDEIGHPLPVALDGLAVERRCQIL